MDDRDRNRKAALRGALAGQWQIPLLVLSLACFGGVLVGLRPRVERLGYGERFAALEGMAGQRRYAEFYVAAEALRQELERPEELGEVHALAAATRAAQLRELGVLGVEGVDERGPGREYERLIEDYAAAIALGRLGEDDPRRAGAYRDLGHAYWCLKQPDKAIKAVREAIEHSGAFEASLHQDLAALELIGRGEGHLERALAVLEEMLAAPECSLDQRGWAFIRKGEVLISQGRQGEVLEMVERPGFEVGQSRYGEAVDLLRGRALRSVGRADEADRLLRELLARTKDRGDLYAQTALELGRINHEQYRDEDARRFYGLVEETQHGKEWYAAGKLGLAECAAMAQRYAEAVGLYEETVALLEERGPGRALAMEQVERSLAAVAQELILRRDYEQALAFMEVEQRITEDLHAMLRYGRTLASRGEQLLGQLRAAESESAESTPTEQEGAWVAQQREEIRGLFGKAGEVFLAVTGEIIGDDGLYGDTLWQGATCFDKAGDTERAIEVWGRFVAEREGKPAWPRALFHLGQAYHSVGRYEEAVKYYEALHRTHPKSLAAFDAMVPLAKCYLGKRPAETGKAKALLEGVLADVALTPRSVHFREALWQLGQLQYDEGAYAEAIGVLTEAIQRYPEDERLGKYLFLVGDSYRQSGRALDGALAELGEDPAGRVNRQRLHEQRRRYLEEARGYFGRAVEFYEGVPEERRGELDRMYLRQCWLYAGDCLYELGRYSEAVEVYELAALRYQLTPTALAAFNQVINCHLKLGQEKEARATAQRARWQLKEMPAGAFTSSPTALTRGDWEGWYGWVGSPEVLQ